MGAIDRFVDLTQPLFRLGVGLGGWQRPAVMSLNGEQIPTSLHVATVGLSHRGRDDRERRFQNPDTARPVEDEPSRLSLLVGLWDDDPLIRNHRPVVAIADAEQRKHRLTRWSVFLSLSNLRLAEERGWATQVTDTGERIIYARPELLPLAVETYRTQADTDDTRIQSLASAHYQLESELGSPQPRNRLRRAVQALVRDSTFSTNVLRAYSYKCAMCGLTLPIIQGAHIHPVAAEGSVDHVSNGIALCGNHHLAFDKHLIAVRPGSLDVVFHPDILVQVERDPAVAEFVRTTYPVLSPPASPHRIDSMLEKRYAHFSARYRWLVTPGESAQ